MIPKINAATMESIVEEVYIKNEDFGIDEFRSGLEKENIDAAYVLYSFIDSIADYMSEEDDEKMEKYSAIAKMSCNLLYKTIEKQIEINEMDYE